MGVSPSNLDNPYVVLGSLPQIFDVPDNVFHPERDAIPPLLVAPTRRVSPISLSPPGQHSIHWLHRRHAAKSQVLPYACKRFMTRDARRARIF